MTPPYMSRRPLIPLLLVPFLVLATGCSSSLASLDVEQQRSEIRGEGQVGAPSAPSEAVSALEGQVAHWIGTPYKWGGTSKSGVDCSAFVQQVFADALGVPLPRTTRQQRTVGRKVGSNLEPADLVFFRTPKRTDHVGIYLGDGRFAHASTSRGVMISSLDEPYWSRAFDVARRAIEADPERWTAEPETVSEPLMESPESPPSSNRRGRTGW